MSKSNNKYFTVLILFLPFILTYYVYAQSNTIEELKHNPNYEVKITADSTAEIYNKRTNLRWMKSIKNYTEPENARDANLIIDLDTLNLAYWANLYYQWGGLDAANFLLGAKFIVTDANKNGKNEIYAFNDGYSTIIFENNYDSSFIVVDSIGFISFPIYDIGDITNNGLSDIIIRSDNNKLRFFRQDSSNGYIDKLDFIYHPFPANCQPNDVTFYDLDNDGVQELIYYLDASPIDSAWAQSNHVARYNPEINNIIYNNP